MSRTAVTALLLTLAMTANAVAQGLPGTDIWLADIENGLPAMPIRISDGGGYNNQPHFSADGQVIYYTREMPGDVAAQTDIAAFNVATSGTVMVTDTAESEYSPTPVPGREALSFIRVEADQRQRLWAVGLPDGGMELLFPAIEPVGYHAWFSERDVALFILGETFTLQTARLGADHATRVADHIGRSIRRHPQSGEVLFVDKGVEPWQIAALDPETGLTRRVMPLFPGSEDFTIDSSGDYWTGNRSKLYRRSAGDARWQLMADFSAFGIDNISRLAVHSGRGKIALVGDQAVQP